MLRYRPAKLPDNRIDFKLFSARYFLDKLIYMKNIQTTILDSHLNSVMEDIHYEGFLTACIGAFDALLIVIIDKCNLDIDTTRPVYLKEIKNKLTENNYKNMLEEIVKFENESWFLSLKKLRNRIIHKGKLQRMTNYNPFLENTSHYIAFEQDAKIPSLEGKRYFNEDSIETFENYLYELNESIKSVISKIESNNNK
jgi:hypothetical protein